MAKSKVSDATRQNNFIFELDKGQYIPGNNHIKALINNTIECSLATRTLKELDSTHIVLNSNDLEQGCEIDVYYVERYDIKIQCLEFLIKKKNLRTQNLVISGLIVSPVIQ